MNPSTPLRRDFAKLGVLLLGSLSWGGEGLDRSSKLLASFTRQLRRDAQTSGVTTGGSSRSHDKSRHRFEGAVEGSK